MDALALEFEPGRSTSSGRASPGSTWRTKAVRRANDAGAGAGGHSGDRHVVPTGDRWGGRPLTPEDTARRPAPAACRSSARSGTASQFLYDEWAHPFFVSVEEYGRMLVRLPSTGSYAAVELADWTAPTLATWRHSNWVGVFDPWPVVRAGPRSGTGW